MATRNAAKIIKWDQKIGTIETGKLADLIIVDGLTGDPFELLLHASEKDLSLVVINGVPRCGSKNIMKKFAGKTETVDIGNTTKLLNLVEKEENPVVGKLQLSDATTKLKRALKDLKSVAKKMPLLKEITGPDNTRFFVPVTQKSGK